MLGYPDGGPVAAGKVRMWLDRARREELGLSNTHCCPEMMEVETGPWNGGARGLWDGGAVVSS